MKSAMQRPVWQILRNSLHPGRVQEADLGALYIAKCLIENLF